MPTTHPAEGPARSASAPAKLLEADDLHDPAQFVTHARVPILDVNDDPEHGTVDEPLLRLIARNSNRRFRYGQFPTLSLGHTRAKQTVIVVKDGKQVVYPATDEDHQPAIVGHASNFDVGEFDGKPCLYADFHVQREHADQVKGFPFRSVERLSPNPDKEMSKSDEDEAHYIDRIALLRTPPRRDLGVLRYERDQSHLLRFCYARDFPPLTNPDTPSGPNDMATDASAAPAADETAPDPARDTGADTDNEKTLGEMKWGEFAEAFVTLLEHVSEEPADDQQDGPAPEPEPQDDGGERAQYEEDMGEEMQNDEEGGAPTERHDYEEATQAGGSNTTIPGSCGIGKEKRSMYEANRGGVASPARTGKATTDASGGGNGTAHVTRKQYAADQAEMAELLQYQFDQIVALQLDKRRALYERRLDRIVADGYDLDDEARAELMGEITAESPEDFEERREAEIRKRYARRAVNVPMVPVGSAGFARHVPSGAPTQDETRKATAIAMASGKGFSEALKLVRGA